MRLRRLKFLGVAFAIVAAACSPYDFSKPVSDLAAKAQALDDSITAGHQQMMNDAAAKYRRELVADRSKVAVGENCFVQVSVALKVPTNDDAASTPASRQDTKAPVTPRQLCNVYRPQDKAAVLPKDEFPIPEKLNEAMKTLTNYTSALAAVTNAADRTAYNTAVSNLKDAVSKFPPYGTIAGAGINLLGWVVGTSLDIQRFNSLKDGVNAVGQPRKNGEIPFDAVVQAIAFQVNRYAEHRRDILGKNLADLSETLSPTISEELYRARLADIEAMTAVLEALNQTNAYSVANDLMAAHVQLVKAVNSGQPSLDELTTTLSTLGSDVSALQSALAAASTPPTAPKPVITTSKKGS
jgi:hypothetical protein